MYIYEYIDQFTYMRRHLWAADLLLLCYLHTARGIRAADLASGCFGYIAQEPLSCARAYSTKPAHMLTLGYSVRALKISPREGAHSSGAA